MGNASSCFIAILVLTCSFRNLSLILISLRRQNISLCELTYIADVKAHIADVKAAKDAGILLSYDPNLRLRYGLLMNGQEGILGIWDTDDIIHAEKRQFVTNPWVNSHSEFYGNPLPIEETILALNHNISSLKTRFPNVVKRTNKFDPREQAMAEDDTPQEIADREKVFKQFDTDGDGNISKTELGEALKMLGSVSPEEVTYMMDELDTDKDGFISFEEFTEFARANRGLIKDVAKIF